MFKRLVRSPAIMAGFGVLVWAYMAVLMRTLRWRVEGLEHARDLWERPEPFLIATWHSRILLMPVIKLRLSRSWPARPHRMAVMVSASRDGEITQQVAKMLDLHVIRASAAKKNSNKDKRGVQGAREALGLMAKGACICLNIDGPRGPREVVGTGAVKLAQQVSAPILVYGLSVDAIRLDTWDRLLFPAPFARAAVVFGPPIPTSKAMDTDMLCREVEQGLKAVTARADALAGLRPDRSTTPVPEEPAADPILGPRHP